MNLSRRTLLAATGATAVTAATTLMTTAGTAHASPVADASAEDGTTAAPPCGFDTLLQRAESLLTGGGFDPADPDFTDAVAALDTTAGDLWDTLDRGSRPHRALAGPRTAHRPGQLRPELHPAAHRRDRLGHRGHLSRRKRAGGGRPRRRTALHPRHRVQPGQARDRKLVVLGDRRPACTDGLLRRPARPASRRRPGGLSRGRRPLLPGRGPPHQLPHTPRDRGEPHRQGRHRGVARAAGTRPGQARVGP